MDSSNQTAARPVTLKPKSSKGSGRKWKLYCGNYGIDRYNRRVFGRTSGAIFQSLVRKKKYDLIVFLYISVPKSVCKYKVSMQLRNKSIRIAIIVCPFIAICNGKNNFFPKWRPNYLYSYRHFLLGKTNWNANCR